jgi:hypothetical protein
MEEMMNPSSVYGPVDPQPQENPYAAFQAVSGTRLTSAGPTTATDQTAYGNNDPRFYTKQDQNLNNAGPPSFYQPIQQGYGAGVSPTPSQFTPAYYLSLHNRSDKMVRVAKGVFMPTGMPNFQPPRSVDDMCYFEFPQAQPGMRYPLLIELTQRAIYFKTVIVPTGQNQGQLYLPFERELIERNAPKVQIGAMVIYADSPQELSIASSYLRQFTQTPVANAQSGQMRGSLSTANSSINLDAVQQTVATPVATPAAPSGPSPLLSVLLILGGAAAAHYLETLGE